MKLFLGTLIYCLFCFYSNGQDTAIYVSDAGNFNNGPWQILKFDVNGENPETFIEDHLGWPQDILFLEDQGVVLITNLNTDSINRHDAETGSFIDAFATGPDGPTRMAIGPDGLIYVLQWLGNGKVFRYEQDGTFVDEFTETGVTNSIGLAWDADGNLYVSSYSGDLVRRFGPDGGDLGNFISENLVGPTNIWFDSNGDLLVSDYNAGSIKRFDSDGNYLGVYIGGLSQGEGYDYLANGDLLIGNGGTGAVKQFNSAGIFIEDLIESNSGGLIRPNAVVVREIGAVGLPEEDDRSQLVFPSVGHTFFAMNIDHRSLQSVEVFSMTGQSVMQTSPVSNLVWNAQDSAISLAILNWIVF